MGVSTQSKIWGTEDDKHFSPVDVLKAGKAHGALQADLFGCLYFYLSDQLREFHARLSRFKINFKVFETDALDLSRSIRSGSLSQYGILSTTRFDRIDTSNIVDMNYVGLGAVLENWGALLSESPHATLIGCFMNWAVTPGAKPEGEDAARLIKQLMDQRKVCALFIPA